MPSIRVIPVLLLKDQGLIKTIRFKDPTYIGDPINAVKIFNDKGADELILLDITATLELRKPNIRLISQIASECFMPLAYGGGVNHVDDVKNLFNAGIEKVVLCTSAIQRPFFVKEVTELYGSQSIVVSIDVMENMMGKYEVFVQSGNRNTHISPVEIALQMQAHGAGELLINSIDRDGTLGGYDIELIRKIASAVTIPVIACGGAGQIGDFIAAVQEGGASAVAAGSMFVFHGRHRAVLINYPSEQVLESISQKI